MKNNDIFKRYSKNPILKPISKIPWANLKIYNPSILFENKKFLLFFRSVGQANVSKIGLAISADGLNFKINKEPILSPELDIEKDGVEDPRIVKIEKTYYLTYTAYDRKSARLCLATSNNLINWHRHGRMLLDWNFTKAGGFTDDCDSAQKTPEAKLNWSKAGAIFPKKINNKYWMIFGDRNIWMAYSTNGINWLPVMKPFLKPRKNRFDCSYIEVGPIPIKTKKGWLVLYHGVNKDKSYQIGFLLLDLNNPQKIIYRANNPIFLPFEADELRGLVDIMPGGLANIEKMDKKALNKFISSIVQPRVIFCNGAILKKDTLRIYYGINDTYIGTATAKLQEVLSSK